MTDKDIILRLNIIGGQVNGVKKMLARGYELDSVLIQISAIKSSLNSVSKLLIEEHIIDFESDNGDCSVKELIKTIEKSLK